MNHEHEDFVIDMDIWLGLFLAFCLFVSGFALGAVAMGLHLR